MPRLALIFGTLLTLEGAGFYVAAGASSWTALIPALVGLPLLLLGLAARKPSWRKHAMHAAAVLALLGTLAPVARLASSPLDLARPATWSQLGMALLCGLFFLLCLKSFVDARRRAPDS